MPRLICLCLAQATAYMRSRKTLYTRSEQSSYCLYEDRLFLRSHTYGLPCCHTSYRQLHRSATSELKVGLDTTHEHWLVKRPHRNFPYIPIDSVLLIQDPAVVQRRRGRPKGPNSPRRSDNSTCREPSRFETVGNNTGNVGRCRGCRRARGGRSRRTT